MDKTKTPRGRRKYFSDYPFTDIPKKNGKGTKHRRVYSGAYFSYVIPDDYKKEPDTFVKRIKGFYGVITFLMIALWLGAGFVDASSQRGTFYVVAPYLIMALPIFLTAFTIVEFLFTKKTRYERVFADAISSKLRVKTIAAMIGSGFCALTEIVYLIIKASQNAINDGVIKATAMHPVGEVSISVWNDVIYAALFIALGFLAFFFLKLQDGLKLEEV